MAVALVWSWLYNPDFGVINLLLAKIGIQGPGWLTSQKWAMPSVIIMSVWHGMGYNMVIFLAGLQGIPVHLYEAAKIDGANWWSEFRHITLPMLSPTTFFILIISIIGSFQVFGQIYMMTRGGPANATMCWCCASSTWLSASSTWGRRGAGVVLFVITWPSP